MKIACYFLFSTVLNKLFHITDVYIYSTRQNNNWINKNDPVQKFTYHWILIPCVISWMIHAWLFLYFVIVVHEYLVGPEQFNCCSSEKSSSSCTFFGFPASLHLCIFQPFPKVTVWFWDDWWVPQLSSVLKDGFQNHTVNVGKGSKYAEELLRTNNGPKQLSQNIKTVVHESSRIWHIVLRFNFWMGSFW